MYQGNQITFDHCTFNGNSRRDGYNNVNVSGFTNSENLAVTFIGCDIEGAGTNPYTTVTTAFGLVVQYSKGVSFIGCYIENNYVSGNVYIDSTAVNLAFIGCYFQDGAVSINAVDGLIWEKYKIWLRFL